MLLNKPDKNIKQLIEINMKKLMESIKKLKQKNNPEIISFDFLDKKPIVKKKFNPTGKILKYMVFSQFIFLLANMSSLVNLFHNKDVEMKNMLSQYTNLTELTRQGQQQEAIITFSKIIEAKDPIGDLLLGGFVLLNLSQDASADYSKLTPEEKYVEENRYKLTPETKNTLIKMYKENWKIGINNKREQFNNYNCIMFDLSCFALKKLYENTGLERLNLIENKINITNYNIDHIDEFKKWREQTNKTIEYNMNDKNKVKLPILDNPGQIAFPG